MIFPPTIKLDYGPRWPFMPAGRSFRCRKSLGLLSVLLTLGSGAAAQETAYKQDTAYRLEAGDRVALAVFGQPELAGEFVVGGEGSILLPLLGEVPVARLTVPELQKRVTERLADGYLHQPVVSVRISEMRPIYVLGDIRTPGSYPFRHGATVLSAIALGGGFALPEPAQFGLRTEYLLAEERVRALESTWRSLIVRRTRLEAQRDDAAEFPTPEELPRDDAARTLVASEREVLDMQRKAMLAEIALLQQQKPRLDAEIVGNRAQAAAEQTQLTLIQEHLTSYNQLINSGLARRYTGIELQREEARNKGTIARLSSELARLELNIGDLAVRVQDVRNAYKRRVISDLQEARTRLAEVETALPIAREVREARIQQGGALGTTPASELRRNIVITRMREGKAEAAPGDAWTALNPGDIVEVRRDGRRDEGVPTLQLGQRAAGTLAGLPDTSPPANPVPGR